MYIQRKGSGMMGLAGAESCGSNQQWDAGCNYYGIQGQCVPTGMVGKQAGCTYSSSSSSGSIWDKLLSGATDIIKAKVTPAPVTNVSAASGGMSTTTKVAIAGAAVVGLALILRSRK
jgi:hypothetical protein